MSSQYQQYIQQHTSTASSNYSLPSAVPQQQQPQPSATSAYGSYGNTTSSQQPQQQSSAYSAYGSQQQQQPQTQQQPATSAYSAYGSAGSAASTQQPQQSQQQPATSAYGSYGNTTAATGGASTAAQPQQPQQQSSAYSAYGSQQQQQQPQTQQQPQASSAYGSYGSQPQSTQQSSATTNAYGSYGSTTSSAQQQQQQPATSAYGSYGSTASAAGGQGASVTAGSVSAPSTIAAAASGTTAATAGSGASAAFGEEVNAMLVAHKAGRKFDKKQGTGGIFPISIDPDTNEIWILLGLNSANQYCHFHGWIEEGETLEQGTARQGWVVSRGLLGTQADLWRALMLGGNYSMQFVGSSQIVLVGAVRAAERPMWASAFTSLPAFYDDMEEVVRVDWINARSFRNACINFSQDRIDGYPVFETQKKPTTFIGTGKYYVQGFAPNCVLRPFLHNWLCSRDGVAWLCDSRYVDLLEKGQLGKLKSLPALPPIKADERAAIIAALKIPSCKDCGQEGHASGICVAVKDKKARRRGTLSFQLKEFTNEQGQRQQSVVPLINDNQSAIVYALTKEESSKWVEWLHAVVENVPSNQDKVAQPKQWNEMQWQVTFRPRMKGPTTFVGKEVVCLPHNQA